MNTVRIVNATEYRGLSMAFELHFLQSLEWGEFKARHGWQPVLLAVFNESGDCIGLGQYLKRAAVAGKFLAYFAKGPACNYADGARVQELVQAINQFIKREQQDIAFVRYEMDLIEAIDGQAAAIDPANFLRATGCLKAPADIQYRDTRKLALGSEASTWDAFSSKQRNKIKIAPKKEVRIERCTDPLVLEEFFAVYQETATRNNIFIHDLDYYRDFFTTFVGSGQAEFYGAWYQDRMLSAAFIVHYGHESIYMYSGSSDYERNRRPNEAIQWEAIQEAIRRGSTVYDFWGVAPWEEADHPWAGLSEFKASFGGQHLRYIGCWDYPCHGFLYRALVLVEKLRKVMLQLKKRLRR